MYSENQPHNFQNSLNDANYAYELLSNYAKLMAMSSNSATPSFEADEAQGFKCPEMSSFT